METDRVQRDRLQCVLHMYSSIVTTEDNNYVLPPENVLDVIHQDSLNRLKALIVSSRLLSNTHTHTSVLQTSSQRHAGAGEVLTNSVTACCQQLFYDKVTK